MHDLTAARAHAPPALYNAAATGLPTLADSGYEGAGIGILIPVKQPTGGRELDINACTAGRGRPPGDLRGRASRSLTGRDAQLSAGSGRAVGRAGLCAGHGPRQGIARRDALTGGPSELQPTWHPAMAIREGVDEETRGRSRTD